MAFEYENRKTESVEREEPELNDASTTTSDSESGSAIPPLLSESGDAAPAPGSNVETDVGLTGDSAEVLGRFARDCWLHPSSLLFSVWRAVRGVLVPILILLFIDHNSNLVIFIAGIAGLSILWGAIHYFTFRYRVVNGELITREGLLERVERNIPLQRIQDIRIEQGLLHRWLGMADVKVETAGGGGVEASLSVMRCADAELLRRAVFENPERAGVAGEPAADGSRAASEPTRLLRALSIRELVLAGITSNRMASVFVAVAAVGGAVQSALSRDFLEEHFSRAGRWLLSWIDSGGMGDWAILFLLVLAFLAVSLGVSVLGSIILFHQFRLSRSGEDLFRSYGLLTKRTTSLPRKRVQLIEIEETWLRRWFKLVAIKADTAGYQPEDNSGSAEGRDVVLPVLPRSELGDVLPEILPDVRDEVPDWRRVEPCAIRREILKGTAVILVVTAVTLVVRRDFFGFMPLLLLPWIAFFCVRAYQHLGYAVGERLFHTRRGWLNRSTHIVPIRNVQAIVLRQNPFDRRHGVVSLAVDTAGQAFTGGGPRIGNVDEAKARQLARELAASAAGKRFRW